jgi:putative phosphoesterase
VSRLAIRRLGALGDIHSEDRALEAALQFFEERGPDAVVAVGDLVDGEGDVNRVLRLLVEHNVQVVRGNHDRWIVDDEMRDLPHAHPLSQIDPQGRELLASLPQTQSISTCRGDLLLCHGVGDDDMQRLAPDDTGYALESNRALLRLLAERRYAYVLGGHTHRRMVRPIGGITFFNAGTLRRGDDPCFLWLDFERRVAEFHDVSSEGVLTGEAAIAF